jgi:hypothetical protein
MSLLPRAPDSFDRPSIELVRIAALPPSGARHAIAFFAIGSVYNRLWKESFYHHTGSVVGPLSDSLKVT